MPDAPAAIICFFGGRGEGGYGGQTPTPSASAAAAAGEFKSRSPELCLRGARKSKVRPSRNEQFRRG